MGTEHKDVHQLDEHDSRYKLIQVGICPWTRTRYLLLHAVSSQLWISSFRQHRDTWAVSKRENKGTPKSGISELLSSLALRP